jgi:hypothetical protein
MGDYNPIVDLGYHGLKNVTVKSMLIQDILYHFKNYPAYFKGWRCSLLTCDHQPPINIDGEGRLVTLCSLFLTNCDYSTASHIVCDVLYDYMDRTPPVSLRSDFN